jgi:phage virion morphogenesis protein
MSQRIDALEPWMAAIINGAGPAASRRLANQIAKALRQSQQTRIAAQKNPDGSPYAQRKIQLRSKTGRISARQDMFRKLRTARFLKAKATTNAAIVGFSGNAARIAMVHQWGLRDRVENPGPLIRYRQRRLLGFTDDDRNLIAETVLDSVLPK